MTFRARYLVLTILTMTLAGCESNSEKNRSVETTDAGVEKPRSKVEQALANAVKSGAVAATASSSGPPADGIMEQSRADADIASVAPPKLTVGGEGSGPKFLLRSEKATLPKAVSMELSIQAGVMDQGLPPISVALALESKKGEIPGAISSVTAKIREVKVTMPNVPAEFTQQLQGLKGSKIAFSLSAEGGGFAFNAELPKGAKPELKELLDTVSEGLSLLTVPVPKVAVGTGAFWMVASREILAGFGLVSYRMVKIRSVSENGAELEYDARRYAVGHLVDPALLPPGSPPATLKEMSAAAKATFKVSLNSVIATEMDSSSAIRGAIDAGDAPGPQGQPSQRMLQSGTSYRIAIAK